VKNLILEFRPRPTQDMLVACLWSRWVRFGRDRVALVRGDHGRAPTEVFAAGHDRCIIPIRPENIDAWLSPRSEEPRGAVRDPGTTGRGRTTSTAWRPLSLDGRSATIRPKPKRRSTNASDGADVRAQAVSLDVVRVPQLKALGRSATAQF